MCKNQESNKDIALTNSPIIEYRQIIEEGTYVIGEPTSVLEDGNDLSIDDFWRKLNDLKDSSLCVLGCVIQSTEFLGRLCYYIDTGSGIILRKGNSILDIRYIPFPGVPSGKLIYSSLMAYQTRGPKKLSENYDRKIYKIDMGITNNARYGYFGLLLQPQSIVEEKKITQFPFLEPVQVQSSFDEHLRVRIISCGKFIDIEKDDFVGCKLLKNIENVSGVEDASALPGINLRDVYKDILSSDYEKLWTILLNNFELLAVMFDNDGSRLSDPLSPDKVATLFCLLHPRTGRVDELKVVTKDKVYSFDPSKKDDFFKFCGKYNLAFISPSK